MKQASMSLPDPNGYPAQTESQELRHRGLYGRAAALAGGAALMGCLVASNPETTQVIPEKPAITAVPVGVDFDPQKVLILPSDQLPPIKTSQMEG